MNIQVIRDQENEIPGQARYDVHFPTSIVTLKLTGSN